MIKMSVYYPADRGSKFDHDYYRTRHMPLIRERLGDACLRYEIDLSRRTKHSALLDSELLAEVYIELIGGRQASLVLGEEIASAPTIAVAHHAVASGERPVPRIFTITESEIALHRAAVATLGAAAIWANYLPPAELSVGAP